MKRYSCLLAVLFFCACAHENPVEVDRIPPLRESHTNPPCVEVICLVDSLGVVVSCDTSVCQ